MTTRSIYIVDDDDAVRASLHSLLSVRPDTLIRGYKSGDAFLAAMSELEPGCLLLDFHMPGATGLDVSPRTVEIYRANVMTKLGVKSLSEALRIAFAAGLVPHTDG